MWERYGASAWTTCRSTANATSGGSGPSTRDIATSTGRTSRGSNDLRCTSPADIPAGLRELYRVLEPGGRLIIAERLTRPGARGLAAHGFTETQAAEMAAAAQSVGFAVVQHDTRRAGRRMLATVRARRPASKP